MTYCWNCKNYSFCRTVINNSYRKCIRKHEVRVVSRHSNIYGLEVLSTYIDNRSELNWDRHEIEVLFAMHEEKLVFMGGRETNYNGDWFWNSNDVSLFECEHPGLLKSIETDMNTDNIRYII